MKLSLTTIIGVILCVEGNEMKESYSHKQWRRHEVENYFGMPNSDQSIKSHIQSESKIMQN